MSICLWSTQTAPLRTAAHTAEYPRSTSRRCNDVSEQCSCQHATKSRSPEVVAALEDDFRRHVVWSTNHAHTHRLACSGQFAVVNGAKAEICELEIAAAGQQQVFGLDVAMNEAFGVNVAEGKNNLADDETRFILVNSDKKVR